MMPSSVTNSLLSFCSCFLILCCRYSDDKKTLEELNDDKQTDQEVKKLWKQIELPESIGRLKPTEIAIEPEPISPPPLVIVENKQIKDKTNTENDYDIYNLDNATNYV
jgi:hypothetical protein